jgi:isocitrate/isopropylmalate dehydrogenase
MPDVFIKVLMDNIIDDLIEDLKKHPETYKVVISYEIWTHIASDKEKYKKLKNI